MRLRLHVCLPAILPACICVGAAQDRRWHLQSLRREAATSRDPTSSLPPLCPSALRAGVRLGQLSLQRGEDQRHKILIVEGLDPGEFDTGW